MIVAGENEDMPVGTMQAGMIETLLHTSTLDEVQKKKIEQKIPVMIMEEADEVLVFLRNNQRNTLDQQLDLVLRWNK